MGVTESYEKNKTKQTKNVATCAELVSESVYIAKGSRYNKCRVDAARDLHTQAHTGKTNILKVTRAHKYKNSLAWRTVTLSAASCHLIK